MKVNGSTAERAAGYRPKRVRVWRRVRTRPDPILFAYASFLLTLKHGQQVAKLQTLAADPSVKGVVIPVEGLNTPWVPD